MSVRAWLVSVVYNFCRHRRRMPRLDKIPHDVPSDEPFPDDAAAAREAASMWEDAVRDRIECLTPLQSAALNLRLWEGVAYSEIASELGLRIGTARALVHRAKNSIRMADWVILKKAARRTDPE